MERIDLRFMNVPKIDMANQLAKRFTETQLPAAWGEESYGTQSKFYWEAWIMKVVREDGKTTVELVNPECPLRIVRRYRT